LPLAHAAASHRRRDAYYDGRLPAKAYKQQHRSQAARSIL
jgi:hypothetical protein